MKITATLNGVKLTYELPTAWEQVSFRKCIALKDVTPGETSKALSVLLNVPRETMDKATVGNLLTEVVPALAFMAHPLPQDVPKTCLGYPIPHDLNVQEIARFEDLKLILEKLPKEGEPVTEDHLKLYCDIVAVYAMPEYINSTDHEKEYFASQFMDAPCTEVMAIGNFTVVKYLKLKAVTELGLRPTSQPFKRIRLVSLIWLKNLAFTVRYWLWNLRARIRGTS